MSPGLWILHWLLSARAFLAADVEAEFEAAREQIEGRDFWVVRDPARPSLSWREIHERHAIGYRVLVEVGLEAELPSFVRTVGEVLDDPRGWKAGGRELLPVRSNARFTVLLARPRTVNRLCRPLRTRGQYSCGREGRATLNLMRWREGAATWGEDVDGYRVYMINHEVGHLLGNPHARCSGPGEPAPVMMQQTIELGDCEAEAWPSPAEIERVHRHWN